MMISRLLDLFLVCSFVNRTRINEKFCQSRRQYIYMKQKFPKNSEAKFKERIFVGQKILSLMHDENIGELLNPLKKTAWQAFKYITDFWKLKRGKLSWYSQGSYNIKAWVVLKSTLLVFAPRFLLPKSRCSVGWLQGTISSEYFSYGKSYQGKWILIFRSNIV